MKLFAVPLVAAAVAVVLASPAVALPNNRVELIRGQGSDSTVDVMQNLDRAYNNTIGCAVIPASGPSRLDHQCQTGGPPFTSAENWDHDVAMSFFSLGSSNGIRMLQEQGNPGVARIDYARSSRAPRLGDNVNSRFVAYARDAVPWVNFRDEAGSPSAGVSNLTQQQIKNIFLNCSANSWDDVGASSTAAILVWTSQQGSGERATFDEFLGGNSESCIPAQYKDSDLANGTRVIFENDPTPIRDCEVDPAGTPGPSCAAGEELQSIYHMGFGAYQAFPDDPALGKAAGADLGSIDGVAPTAATIAPGGGYPYSRFIYNAYRNTYGSNNAPAAAIDYIGEKGWICKDNALHGTNPKTGDNYGVEIDNIISDTGFVPLALGAIGGGVSGDSKCRVTPVPTP